MLIGVCKETYPGECRVALIPATLPALAAQGLEVIIEAGAGTAAGFPDEQYVEKGARIAKDRAEVFAADVVLQVRSLGANPEVGQADLALLGEGQTVIGTFDPLSATDSARMIAKTGATVFALELIPRITRAQSMDVLSSMATVAGYRAVLLGAMTLPKMFPMFMTAAGTIKPAKVFVIGAGVAGLQAIATAKRLGAVVSAYDVRPAVKDQVESLGAKFVEMQLEAEAAEDKGGYARQMDEEFYRKQRELMAEVVAESDVVVTTAAIPGRQSPLLITADAVRGMQPGSVIIDLAAERGGNCELSQADETVVEQGVTILGPTNLPTDIPYHASQMFSKNISTFLLHLVNEGKLELNLEDEITGETLVARGGEVVNERLLNIMGQSAAKETT
jgi:NAD(P) transhydrogenase subunit alpha